MSAAPRLYFIDALRAFAILMMLQGHFISGLLDPVFKDPDNPIYSFWLYCRGFTAPVFFTITGWVFTFLLLRNTTEGWNNPKGLIVIGVEFRNIGGVQGNHPFPAGLNDCYAALKWVNDQKETLGISKVIVSGESGGGNLSLATTLKAKKENALHLIDGVFAQCPYISNQYAEPEKSNLPSLLENDKYVINVEAMNIMASMYDGASSDNPLAWPYYANQEDLRGLPPHVVYVNELDPLRDEGIAYHEKLNIAKVASDLVTLKGTVHAAEGLFPTQLPEIHQQVQNHIKDFAESL